MEPIKAMDSLACRRYYDGEQCLSRECLRKEDAAEAALAHSALEAADLSAQLDAMHEAMLKQDKLFKELQACTDSPDLYSPAWDCMHP